MSESNDQVCVTGYWLLHETDKAYGIAASGEAKKVEIWLPKSQADVTMAKGPDGKETKEIKEAVMPRWLAEKNDLDYEDW